MSAVSRRTLMAGRRDVRPTTPVIRRSLDIASSASINTAVAAVLKRWGRVDVLVNNAIHWGGRRPFEAPLFEQLPPEEWKASLRANTEVPYAAIQAVVPSMKK